MEASLKPQEVSLLRVLRAEAGRSLDELSASLALPRTNFGRRLNRDLSAQLSRLVEDGLVEQHGDGYRLTRRGRTVLADHMLDSVG